MALSLKIIDSPRGETVTRWNMVLPAEGGTIGRKTNSTMVLNDSRRIVSGTHAQITLGESGYRITDLSTNGLFLNRSSAPLGRNKSVGLNDGDILTIGGYTLLVSIDEPSAKVQRQQAKPQPQPQEEVFDPFAASAAAASPSSVQAEGTAKKCFDFPDPFAGDPFEQTDQNENDLYITANSYDYTRSMNKSVKLDPKDNILDDEMAYTISPDPFADTSTNDNVVKPSASASMNMDRRNMFGGNPFNSSNELIDTPLGDISEFSGGYISMNIAMRKLQQNMEEALTMALNRFLEEIEPSHFEDICSVFNHSRLFFLKPKYWNSYKEFFAMNRSNNEWQNKFIMYFREALDIVRNKNKM